MMNHGKPKRKRQPTRLQIKILIPLTVLIIAVLSGIITYFIVGSVQNLAGDQSGSVMVTTGEPTANAIAGAPINNAVQADTWCTVQGHPDTTDGTLTLYWQPYGDSHSPFEQVISVGAYARTPEGWLKARHRGMDVWVKDDDRLQKEPACEQLTIIAHPAYEQLVMVTPTLLPTVPPPAAQSDCLMTVRETTQMNAMLNNDTFIATLPAGTGVFARLYGEMDGYRRYQVLEPRSYKAGWVDADLLDGNCPNLPGPTPAF